MSESSSSWDADQESRVGKIAGEWRGDQLGGMKSPVTNGLLFLVIAFLLSSCAGVSVRATEITTSAKVMRFVNQERAKRGLGRVVPDEGLRTLAQGHSGFLVGNVYPQQGKPTRSAAHGGFQDRAKKAREAKYVVLSEVVMIGYRGNLSAVAERTIQGWLNSPGHRRAILNKDRHIMGIETRLPGDGRYFVVGLLSNGKTK